MSIHQSAVLSRKHVASLGAGLVVSGMLLLPGHGIAQIVTMNDGGSSATIDLGSSAGMNNWSVLGQNQLNQQWFWYRTGGGVAQPINTIGGLTYQTYSGNTGINEVVATYQNSQLSIEIDYFLSGSGVGSGGADLTETIMAENKSGGQLDLNFYEYSNFNLLQSGNNSVSIFEGLGGTIMLRKRAARRPLRKQSFHRMQIMPKLQISARHWMNSTPSLDWCLTAICRQGQAM